MPPEDSTTIQHKPRTEPEETGREALIIAFPKVAGVPVPKPGTVVGRGWLADAGAADEEVSRNQLVFERRRGHLLVRDAGSRNGTWVDGAPLGSSTTKLECGSIIRCGRTVMVYRQRLVGGLRPSPQRGRLVAPYGLREVERSIEHFASQGARSVLVEGPTGSGKELIAAWVAEAIGRGRTFTAVNVSAIPENVFESHLFGHVKGAFTGADNPHPGVLKASAGGTVFLDEIGSLPPALQPKMLRFLDSFEVQPVGSAHAHKLDVAIVAATNVPLSDLVTTGVFRADLAYRLGMVVVRVPALSERCEDLFSIARALAPALSPDLVEVEEVEAMMRHDWPGNVRQLATVLNEIGRRHGGTRVPLGAVRAVLGPERSTAITRDAAAAALELAQGNQSEAARKLGIPRVTLRRLLGLG